MSMTAQAGQRGFLLIEAMIALVIFSIGILGIVSTQAAAVRAQSDAQHRIEAAYVAERHASAMWLKGRGVAMHVDGRVAVPSLPSGVLSVALEDPDTGRHLITVRWRAPWADRDSSVQLPVTLVWNE